MKIRVKIRTLLRNILYGILVCIGMFGIATFIVYLCNVSPYLLLTVLFISFTAIWTWVFYQIF